MKTLILLIGLVFLQNVYASDIWQSIGLNNPSASGGGGSGTVTSVSATVPSWLTVTGSPVTTSGTLAITSSTISANEVIASPNGVGGALTARALVAADIPTLTSSKLSDFQSATIASPITGYVSGAGTITSADTILSAIEKLNGNAGAGGSTTIGTIDSQTASANGAVISSNVLYLQSASTSNPGLVNATTQSYAGMKTQTTGLTIGTSATMHFAENSSFPSYGDFVWDNTGQGGSLRLTQPTLGYDYVEYHPSGGGGESIFGGNFTANYDSAVEIRGAASGKGLTVYNSSTSPSDILSLRDADYSTVLARVDNTGNVYGKHFVTGGSAPTISSCGSGTLVSGSTDNKGQITGITAATACTITFAASLATAPSCTFSASTALAVGVSSISTSAVTTTMSALTGSLYYICF